MIDLPLQAYEFNFMVLEFDDGVMLLNGHCDYTGHLLPDPYAGLAAVYIYEYFEEQDDFIGLPVEVPVPDLDALISMTEHETGLKNGEFWKLVPLLCAKYS